MRRVEGVLEFHRSNAKLVEYFFLKLVKIKVPLIIHIKKLTFKVL